MPPEIIPRKDSSEVNDIVTLFATITGINRVDKTAIVEYVDSCCIALGIDPAIPLEFLYNCPEYTGNGHAAFDVDDEVYIFHWIGNVSNTKIVGHSKRNITPACATDYLLIDSKGCVSIFDVSAGSIIDPANFPPPPGTIWIPEFPVNIYLDGNVQYDEFHTWFTYHFQAAPADISVPFGWEDIYSETKVRTYDGGTSSRTSSGSYGDIVDLAAFTYSVTYDQTEHASWNITNEEEKQAWYVQVGWWDIAQTIPKYGQSGITGHQITTVTSSGTAAWVEDLTNGSIIKPNIQNIGKVTETYDFNNGDGTSSIRLETSVQMFSMIDGRLVYETSRDHTVSAVISDNEQDLSGTVMRFRPSYLFMHPNSEANGSGPVTNSFPYLGISIGEHGFYMASVFRIDTRTVLAEEYPTETNLIPWLDAYLNPGTGLSSRAEALPADTPSRVELFDFAVDASVTMWSAYPDFDPYVDLSISSAVQHADISRSETLSQVIREVMVTAGSTVLDVNWRNYFGSYEVLRIDTIKTVEFIGG